MKYNYKCINEKCVAGNKVVSIEKPMSESGKVELCKSCSKDLVRQFTVPSISTGDGFKR